MRYILLLVFFLLAINTKASDTLYVEDFKDPRLLEYQDSIKAYEISFSVAKNMADTIRALMGNNSLDDYFLGKFLSAGEVSSSGGYFYDFEENVKVEIGHVNGDYHGMKNEEKFPWKYLESQYRRLDSIKIQPWGVMSGGELPNVYVYAKPSRTIIFKKIKRFTVIDPTIRFFKKDDGKTRISYITKYYYSEFDKGHQTIDSIEKLDPIYQKHLFY